MTERGDQIDKEAIRFRWAVELVGDEFDLIDVRRIFRRGDAICIQIVHLKSGRSATMLMASEFERLADAREVDEASKPIVDFLNGILFVTDAGRKPLRVNAVYDRQLDGEWGNGIAFASVHILGTVRMRAVASTEPSVIPPQVRWMTGAMEDQAANEVLTYLRGAPDWFDLYKAHETMKAPSDQFTETAQAARHSEKWCRQKGIRKHMSLEAAREYVGLLVRNWLDSRFP